MLMQINQSVRPPVFFSGVHGGGKSTLVKRLLDSYEVFRENDFDIDFTIDFPGIADLSSFERSLIRLYHRFFIANYAQNLAKHNPGKYILTNRTIYDSEAYINVYKELGWITQDQFSKLDFLIGNFTPRPYAIILNPPLEVIKSRLNKRKVEATRTARDKIFAQEDSDVFLIPLRNYFGKFKNAVKILYLEHDGEDEIKKIIDWAKNLK